MRPSLIPGMLSAISRNINHKNRDLKFFELGNVYLKERPGVFIERKRLCAGITGEAFSNWLDGSREVSLFDLKGILEALFRELGICDVSLGPAEDRRFSASASAVIKAGGEDIGVMGEVSAGTAAAFDIKTRVFAGEIDMDRVLKLAKLGKRFEELPRYPSIVRDISIVVDKAVSNERLLSAIKESAGPLLKNIRLIDRYSGKQIPDGKEGLTYRLEYQDPKRTLEEKEIAGMHSGVIDALASKFGARLRAG
jgi:phenylalanyl-tRNA synthetase beta chain